VTYPPAEVFGLNLYNAPSMDLSLLSHMSLAGFVTILVLLGCSFLMVALGWELHRRGRSSDLDGEWLLIQLRFLLFQKSTARTKVQDYLAQLGRPVASVCRELLNLETPTLESGDYLLSALLEKERLNLERGLSHLGTIAVIAPFVGLFGTVVGITKTFADVARMKKAGIEVVSAGVSEALVATAIGLLVAIASVVLFNYFKKRFETQLTGWDLTARNLLTLLTSSEEDQKLLFSSPTAPHDTKSAEKFLEG
jgi:biopolymer transport protein ExbB/TolQ